MSSALVYSRASLGIEAPLVCVEIHLSRGLPGFSIVGLPEKAVKESKDRVRSALINCGFKLPPKRIIVNLAPADLPKEGARFDLPIAIGILLASGQLPQQSLEQMEFAGELSLSGQLRPVKAALPLALATGKSGRVLIISSDNLEEAVLVSNLEAYPAAHLLEVYDHLKGVALLVKSSSRSVPKKEPRQYHPDLSEVRGQLYPRRALEVAAAGGHSVLFSGPPGAGKSLLAARLPSLLPAIEEEEALEVAAVYSLSRQGFSHEKWGLRPYRAPHHSASVCALVGGGNPPVPGEISLAHRGVLFLDELPEFKRLVLEALREPLEVGKVVISRVGHQTTFPAKFQMVAAMNPCPCGFLTLSDDRCRCTSEQVKKYQNRISGPLLDRIDLQVPVSPVSYEHLTKKEGFGESSDFVAKRVLVARDQQRSRNQGLNAWLTSSEVLAACQWKEEDRRFFGQAAKHFQMSGRAYFKTLKLARSIADLAQSQRVLRHHLEEALSFRMQPVE